MFQGGINLDMADTTFKIVIAEDEPTSRTFLRHIINRHSDFEIIGEASDGEELVDLASRLKPQVVFVDIEMPELDGMSAVKRLLENNNKLIVIFVTGYSDFAVEAFEIGAFDFILKPYKSSVVEKVLDKISHSNAIELENQRLRLQISYLKEENTKLKEKPSSKYADKYKPICGSTAHSLKNEFISMNNSIKTICELSNDNPDIKEECNIIERGIQYSLLHLQELQNYLNMERFSVEPVDVLELLCRVELIFRPRLPSNVSLEILVAPTTKGTKVSANTEQLLGVMIEILQNACNVLRNSSANENIEIKLKRKDGTVTISIKDSGPGIPNQLRKSIFKKRVPSTRGSGIGLFLSNKVITEFGGRLYLGKFSEKGTEVIIELPTIDNKGVD